MVKIMQLVVVGGILHETTEDFVTLELNAKTQKYLVIFATNVFVLFQKPKFWDQYP